MRGRTNEKTRVKRMRGEVDAGDVDVGDVDEGDVDEGKEEENA